MEYVQMTLNDWLEMKEKIRRELQSVKHSFVRIGYALRKIEDGKLYEQDGYKSIAEFARAEYGLEPSTTSRFISINREYSVDGYSERLRPEYEQMGRSQLEEMLKLPAADRAMIGAETPREDIRELKRFNAAGPETGIADDIKGVIEKFFHDNPEALNDLFAALEEGDVDAVHVSEIINPSGSRAYKKGLYFLMMYENRVSVKKFGQDPQDMGWEEFTGIAKEIFAEAADGDRTWKNYFGGEEDAGDEKGQAVTGQGKDGMDAPEVIPENEEKEAEYGKGDPEDKADTEPDGSTIEEAEYAHPEPLPTEVRIHAEQEPENEPEEQIAPAQSSVESAENLDIPETENAVNETETPQRSAAPKELKVILLPKEKQAFMSAYDAIVDIAARYPKGIREETVGICLCNVAEGIRRVMEESGIILEGIFGNE